jgi:hypothetical protein
MGFGRPPKNMKGLKEFHKKHGEELGYLIDEISKNLAISYYGQPINLDTVISLITDWEISKGTAIVYRCVKCGNDVTGTLVSAMRYGEA